MLARKPTGGESHTVTDQSAAPGVRGIRANVDPWGGHSRRLDRHGQRLGGLCGDGAKPLSHVRDGASLHWGEMPAKRQSLVSARL
jgi:hypothetical protein